MTAREDMKAAAKFKAHCSECNAKSSFATVFTIEKWMTAHEALHRAADRKPVGSESEGGESI